MDAVEFPRVAVPSLITDGRQLNSSDNPSLHARAISTHLDQSFVQAQGGGVEIEGSSFRSDNLPDETVA